jgi:hypothetical protein
MRNGRSWLLALFSIGSIFYTNLIHTGVELKEGIPNPNDIQIVPVDPTPEPQKTELRIQYPSKGHMEKQLPVDIEMRLDWFPLGLDSGEFERRKEIRNSHLGQSIHVFIDNYHYFPINEALFDALDDHDEFFDQIAEFPIPYKLPPGKHIIRAFPCRSFGESLKNPGSSVASYFYYQSEETLLDVDLQKPYLTYNEPQGLYRESSKPILLDFYVNNCTLSKDGYKVRVKIDGENERFLYDWVPYYIHGLKPGTHKIQLELLDPQNNPVPGAFNKVTRSFKID